MRAYSSALRPSSANGWTASGCAAASATVSVMRVLPRGAGHRAGGGQVGQDRGEEAQAVGAGAGEGLHRVLRMRHEAHDVAGLVADAGDVALGAVRVQARVVGDDAALGLELVEHDLVGLEAALAVLQRHDDALPGLEVTGPRRGRVGDLELLVAADEVQAGVAGQRAGQQVRLAQDLEPVADAQHRQAAACGVDDGVHRRGEPADRPAAQVVAVGEATGQHHRVDAVQVGVGVPESHSLTTGDPHRAGRVPVVEGPREGHHADAHQAVPTPVGPSMSTGPAGASPRSQAQSSQSQPPSGSSSS